MNIAPEPNWSGTHWGWCPECRAGYAIVEGHACEPSWEQPYRSDLFSRGSAGRGGNCWYAGCRREPVTATRRKGRTWACCPDHRLLAL